MGVCGRSASTHICSLALDGLPTSPPIPSFLLLPAGPPRLHTGAQGAPDAGAAVISQLRPHPKARLSLSVRPTPGIHNGSSPRAVGWARPRAWGRSAGFARAPG